MLTRIKEYFVTHPNSGVMTAIVFGITTMNTQEVIALISAIGMIISGITGAIMQFLKWRQDKHVSNARLESELEEKRLENERKAIENERLRLENKKLSLTFEVNQNISNDEQEQ